MHQKSIIFAIVIFALLVIGMFTFAFLKKQEMQPDSVEDQTAAAEKEQTTPYDYIDAVDAKAFYQDGTWILVGEILMPTPCDLLTSSGTLIETASPEIELDFAVINNAESCAEAITPARFRIDVAGPPEVSFHGHFMDRHIRVNLIPPAEGETPEDFEVFVKG